jgi:hypothetical protein
MKPRKTMEIIQFKNFINEQLKRTDEIGITEHFKCALCVTLERVLLDANCYHGFNYLYWSDEGGCDQWEKNGKIETFPEKDKYIHGEIGSKYNGNKYARRYY